MKTSKLFLSTLAIVVAASLTVTSCRKKEKTAEVEPERETETANDNALAENTNNDIIAIGSQLSENSGTLTTYRSSGPESLFLAAAGCATVTSALTGSVITSYTVDFGTTGCVGADSRTRKGKLMYDFTQSTNNAKWYRNPGFKMIITSNGYSVDGNAVTINNKVVSNTTPTNIPTGTNPGTNLTWSIVADISIVKANSQTVAWTCNRTKELVNTSDVNCYKGQSLPIDWTKAKIKINGTANGTNAKGENFTAVATDLLRDFTCTPSATQPQRHPFISGTVSYTPGNRATRVIDYGNGSCDFNVTITVNGQTFSTTLP